MSDPERPSRPLPVIAIDNIRASVLPHQVLNRDPPITGLHVGGDSAFLPFTLDENDSILQEPGINNAREEDAEPDKDKSSGNDDISSDPGEEARKEDSKLDKDKPSGDDDIRSDPGEETTEVRKEDAKVDEDKSSGDHASAGSGEELEAIGVNSSETVESKEAGVAMDVDRSEEDFDDDENDSQTDLSRGAQSFEGGAEDTPGDWDEGNWDKMFAYLVAFKKEFGHTDPTFKYKTPDGTKLGTWVVQQKQVVRQWKENKSDIEEPYRQRIERLESIDFNFAWTRSMPWYSWFELLVYFKEKNSHTRVPASYTDPLSGSKVGQWVRNQKNHLKKKELGSPNVEARIQRLDSLGFEWTSFRSQGTASRRTGHGDSAWLSWFGLLVEYKEREGHTRVPTHFVDASTGRKLGTWVSNQKSFHSRKQRGFRTSLTDDREQKLDSVGFEWSVRRETPTNETSLAASHDRTSVDQALSHQAGEVERHHADEEGHKQSKPSAAPESMINTPTARNPSTLSQSSDDLYDDAALAKLEKDLLRKLDDEVTAAEERELLERLDWDIRKAEERDSLSERVGEPFGLVPEAGPWRCSVGGSEGDKVGIEDGIQVEVELDSSLPVGAKLIQRGSELVITINDESGQLAKAIGPRATRAGASVLAVEGLPCESIDDFKRIKSGVTSPRFGLLLRLSVDADLTGLNSECIVNGPFPSQTFNEGTDFVPVAEPVSEAAESVDVESTGATVDKPSVVEREPKASRKAKKATHAAYTDFVNKFNSLVVAEFHSSGIHTNSALGHMWKQHKAKVGGFGVSCPDDCSCISNLAFLTETIVLEQLKKSVEQSDSKWDNPLRLKAGEYPAGLVSNFAQRFVPRLQSEYPDDSSSKILERLLHMWKQHLRTRAFGPKCLDNCECAEGWELVFNKGSFEKIGSGSKSLAMRGPQPETKGKSKKRPVPSNIPATDDHDDIAHANVESRKTSKQSGDKKRRLTEHDSSTAASVPPTPFSLDAPMPRKRRLSSSTIEAPASLQALSGDTTISSGRSESTGDLNSSVIPRKKRLTANDMPHNSLLKSKKPKAKSHISITRSPTGILVQPNADKRGQYCVYFKTGEALGFYAVSSETEETCTVLSVCPRGQATTDARIQEGSTVIATSLAAKRKIFRPVTSHHDLKSRFEEAHKEATEGLFVWFVNEKVTGTPLLDGTMLASEDWSSNGRWRGKSNSGWDGRHAFVTETKLATSVPPGVSDGGRDVQKDSPVLASTEDQELGTNGEGEVWTSISEMRPLLSREFEPRSIVVTEKSSRSGRVRKIQFSDMVEERRYVKGCPTHEFQVTSTSDAGPNPFRDMDDSTSPSSFNAMDELFEAVVNRKTEDVLQFIENGGLSQVGSESDFEPSRTEVKRRLKAIQVRTRSEDGEFSLKEEEMELIRKDRLLKICIHAYSVARQAWSHKCWEGFEIEVVKIHNLQSTSLVQQNPSSMIEVDVAVLEDVGKGRTDGKLPRMKVSQSLQYETSPFKKPVFYNTRTTQKHSTLHLDINMVNGRDPLSLGSARITLAEIQRRCATNRDWTTVEFEATPTSFLSRGTVVLRVRRVSDSFRQRHSQVLLTHARRELHDLITWIRRFNEEAEANGQGRLSADIRTINNITPLHSAVLVRDETLTKMLLEAGANPLVVSGIGTVTSLAQKMAYTVQEGRHENADIASGRGIAEGDDRRMQEHKERFQRIIKRLREHAESLAVGVAPNSDTEKESLVAESQLPRGDQTDTQTGEQRVITKGEAESKRAAREVARLPVLKGGADWIDWKSNGQRCSPCRNWDRDHKCNFGARCTFVHRQRPWDDQLESIWEEMAPSDRVLPKLGGKVVYKWGKKWVTAGYWHSSASRSELLHLVYAEGGTGIRSSQGIYWYESEKEAEHSLKRTMAVSMYAIKNNIVPRSLTTANAAIPRKRAAASDFKVVSKEGRRVTNAERPAVPLESDTGLQVQEPAFSDNDTKTGKKRQSQEEAGDLKSKHLPPSSVRPGTRLPRLTRSQVVEEWTKWTQCHFFGENKKCLNGANCRYAHVEGPIGKVSDSERRVAEVPDGLPFVKLITRMGDDGKLWYTMGCKGEDQTIYLAEGGQRGCNNSFGVWWYPAEQDALSALCVVVGVARMRRGLLQSPSRTGRKRSRG